MPDRTRLENARKPQGDYGRDLLDQMNAGTHARLAAWAFAEMERLVGLPASDACALDVGCGGGANLLRLLERVPEGRVTGVDYSPISVEKSSATCAEAIAAGRCEVMAGDVSALPLSDGRFDLVSAFETIYFWPSLEGGLAEICRVMAPGGALMICCETDGLDLQGERWDGVNEHPDLMRVYATDEVERALRRAGLTPCGHARHPEEGWVCVFGRKA